MRVSCGQIEDFLNNLRESDCSVSMKVVFFQKNTRPIGGENQTTKYEISVVATAMVHTVDADYLLECGESCGRDLMTADADSSGSKRAGFLEKLVESFCRERGWKMLPGICSEY